MVKQFFCILGGEPLNILWLSRKETKITILKPNSNVFDLIYLHSYYSKKYILA